MHMASNIKDYAVSHAEKFLRIYKATSGNSYRMQIIIWDFYHLISTFVAIREGKELVREIYAHTKYLTDRFLEHGYQEP